MTISQIEYFLEVAGDECFSKASERLFISHQALSKHIKALEDELGLVLFDRSNKRKLKLTKEGEILYSEWKPLLIKGRQAYQAAIKEKSLRDNTIRIGIQDIDNIRYTIAAALKHFCKANPLFRVNYLVGTPEELVKELNSGNIDMCCTYCYGNTSIPGCRSAVIGTEIARPVIAISLDNPLAKKDSLSLKDLRNETLLMLSKNYSNYIYEVINYDLKEGNLVPKAIKTLNKFNELELALSMNEGFTIMNDIQCQKMPKTIKYYYFKKDDQHINIQLMWIDSKWNVIAENISELSK